MAASSEEMSLAYWKAYGEAIPKLECAEATSGKDPRQSSKLHTSFLFGNKDVPSTMVPAAPEEPPPPPTPLPPYAKTIYRTSGTDELDESLAEAATGYPHAFVIHKTEDETYYAMDPLEEAEEVRTNEYGFWVNKEEPPLKEPVEKPSPWPNLTLDMDGICKLDEKLAKKKKRAASAGSSGAVPPEPTGGTFQSKTHFANTVATAGVVAGAILLLPIGL